MKSQINIKLSENILEKLDQKAKDEGRTRTNIIENLLKHHLKNYWLWVNSGEMDIGDEMVIGDEYTWKGCDKHSSKGDEVFIYRTSPYKHIKYHAEILEDAKKDVIPTDKGEKEGYSCKFLIIESFENPLEISEMRNYENLKDWYPLKISFIKMVFRIEEKHWNILDVILKTKNPN